MVDTAGVPVAVVTRFDRLNGKRMMFLSARSLMDAAPAEQYSYVDIADAIRMYGSQAAADLQELWIRLVFIILINNVDDHLNNHRFLHHAHGQWKLAPAFDLNPFPDKERALKTWISEDSGDGATLTEAISVARLFGLAKGRAAAVLGEVESAVRNRKKLAGKIGMRDADVKSFAPAFEHPEL